MSELNIVLRKAKIQDAFFLYILKNDPTSLSNSIVNSPVEAVRHVEWLHKVLSDRNRTLHIAEIDYFPVGMIRLDFDVEKRIYEASWSVYREYRGCGVGRQMVRDRLKDVCPPVIAKIKYSNRPSVKIAEKNGFEQVEVDGVFFIYRKG